MSSFRRRYHRESPSINTASLPDIVFMLLFFFMVVTKLKKDDIKLSVKLPKAQESIKLDNKQKGVYIYVGVPIDTTVFGSGLKVQINDEFIDPSTLSNRIEVDMKRLSKSELPFYTVIMRSDANVQMQYINSIKHQLRQANALKLIYTTQNQKSTK